MLFILLLRGPHVPRYGWFGYEGGLEARKHVVEAADHKDTNENDSEQTTATNTVEEKSGSQA